MVDDDTLHFNRFAFMRVELVCTAIGSREEMIMMFKYVK